MNYLSTGSRNITISFIFGFIWYNICWFNIAGSLQFALPSKNFQYSLSNMVSTDASPIEHIKVINEYKGISISNLFSSFFKTSWFEKRNYNNMVEPAFLTDCVFRYKPIFVPNVIHILSLYIPLIVTSPSENIASIFSDFIPVLDLHMKCSFFGAIFVVEQNQSMSGHKIILWYRCIWTTTIKCWLLVMTVMTWSTWGQSRKEPCAHRGTEEEGEWLHRSRSKWH